MGSFISTRSIRQPCGTNSPNCTAIRNLLANTPKQPHHTPGVGYATVVWQLWCPLLPFREGILAIGVAGYDKEEVGEAVDSLKGIGVFPGVAGDDEAALRAAHDCTSDIE